MNIHVSMPWDNLSYTWSFGIEFVDKHMQGISSYLIVFLLLLPLLSVLQSNINILRVTHVSSAFQQQRSFIWGPAKLQQIVAITQRVARNAPDKWLTQETRNGASRKKRTNSPLCAKSSSRSQTGASERKRGRSKRIQPHQTQEWRS